jgi:hypothetical protein
MQGRQTIVARPGAVAARYLEVFQELPQEGRIDIFGA